MLSRLTVSQLNLAYKTVTEKFLKMNLSVSVRNLKMVPKFAKCQQSVVRRIFVVVEYKCSVREKMANYVTVLVLTCCVAANLYPHKWQVWAAVCKAQLS